MELIDIYSEDGEYTGMTKPKSEAHQDGLWHKTVHVWIISEDGQKILLQKRSASKEISPGKWSISAAGHLEAWEKNWQGAMRETMEELGVRIRPDTLKFLKTFKSGANGKDQSRPYDNNEFIDVFMSRMDVNIADLRLQKDEVSEAKWIDLVEFWGKVELNDKEFATHKEIDMEVLDMIILEINS